MLLVQVKLKGFSLIAKMLYQIQDQDNIILKLKLAKMEATLIANFRVQCAENSDYQIEILLILKNLVTKQVLDITDYHLISGILLIFQVEQGPVKELELGKWGT